MPIADTSARVGIEHYVAVCRQHLHLVQKAIAVLGVWPTVYLHNQRVLLRGVKVGRFENPPVHRPPLVARVRNVFGAGQLQFVEQGIIERGKTVQ